MCYAPAIPVEAAIPTEVELKLAARAGDLPKLKRALQAMAPQGRLARSRLSSTYYDTPDLALRRRGLVLRVRKERGRFVQTVKAGDGLLERGEWEDAIAGERPDPAAPQSGVRLPADVASGLQPLFVTGVTRSSLALQPTPGARIEAAIDEGEISAPALGRSEPISEIELELKSGEAALLCDLALQLNEAVPLSIETRSKSERGYRLAAAEATAAPVHAQPLALDAAMPATVALRQIVHACLEHLLRNGPAVLAGDAEGVHQMRVALRRLKVALAAFRAILSPAERGWVGDLLAQLAEVLGRARNLDVLADELLRPAAAALPHEAGLPRLVAAVAAARGEAQAEVRAEIASSAHTARVLRLLRWCEGAGPAPEIAPRLAELAPPRLERCWRRLRRRSKGFARFDGRRRHRLRIAVKDLRYTIDLFGSLFEPAQRDPFLHRLRQLQDDLGYANDRRVAGELVAQMVLPESAAAAAAAMLAWHDAQPAACPARLRQRVGQVRRLTPFWRPPVAWSVR